MDPPSYSEKCLTSKLLLKQVTSTLTEVLRKKKHQKTKYFLLLSPVFIARNSHSASVHEKLLFNQGIISSNPIPNF